MHEGLDPLLYKVADLLDEISEENTVQNDNQNIVEYTFTEKEEKEFEVSMDFKELVYVVSGKKIDEMMRTFNENAQDSVLRFAKKLKEMGVEEELKKIGCKNGDLVRIGKITFEFND